MPAGWKGECQSGEAFNVSTCNRFFKSLLAHILTNYCFFYCFDDLDLKFDFIGIGK